MDFGPGAGLDWSALLNRKYNNLEADQRSAAGLRSAQAGLLGQQTEEARLANLPGQLMETHALPGAQTYLSGLGPAGSFGALTGNANFAGEMGLRSPTTPPSGAPAVSPARKAVTQAVDIGTTPGLGTVKKTVLSSGDEQELNKGTAKVMKKGETRVTDESGNGHPQVDTVPAMLAEGEAVLNAGAAERMGRDQIKALNAQGLRDMKMSAKHPTMKRGGRIGPFQGVSMEDATTDGLRCGTDMVKKYSAGTASVPSDSAVNQANFAKQRDRNMLDEAVVAGTPVASEPAGEMASVTPSQDTARLRQALGLQAQGFADGTANVTPLPPGANPDTVYAAFGMEDVKAAGGKVVDWAKGLRGGAAPVDLGTVGGAAPAAGPTSAAEASIGQQAAAKQAAAAQAARAAMGEAPEMARAATSSAAGAAPSAVGAAPAAPTQGLRSWVNNSLFGGGQLVPDGLGEKVANAAKTGGKAILNNFNTAAGAVSAADDLRDVYNSPAPVWQKIPAGLEAAGNVAGDFLIDRFGGGKLGRTVAGGVTAGATSYRPVSALARKIDQFTGGEGRTSLDMVRQQAGVTQRNPFQAIAEETGFTPNSRQPAAVKGAEQADVRKVDNAIDAQNDAAAAAAAAGPARMSDGEYLSSGLRGLATMGSMLGSRGAQAVLKDITDRESNAASAARTAAQAGLSSANSWYENVGNGMFMTADGKGEDKNTLSQFKNFVNDRLAEVDPRTGQSINVAVMTPAQRSQWERMLINQFNDKRVLDQAVAENGTGPVARLFGGVEPRGRVSPVRRVDNLSFADSLTNPYSVWAGLNPIGTKGVVVRDSTGREFTMTKDDYTKSLSSGLRDPLRQIDVEKLPTK